MLYFYIASFLKESYSKEFFLSAADYIKIGFSKGSKVLHVQEKSINKTFR